MRNFLIASAGMLVLCSVSTVATAEETVIRSESSPSVTVERREGVVEKNVTTSTDCGSKTVHKEDSAGNSKTVHKEGC